MKRGASDCLAVSPANQPTEMPGGVSAGRLGRLKCQVALRLAESAGQDHGRAEVRA